MIGARLFRARGFSIVELMVAMVVGLISMVIIFQVFEVSEGIKRTTTSGGDAQQNGVLALFNIEHDLRNAGMGFNDTTFSECRGAGSTILGYDSARATADFATIANPMLLVPVLITPGATSTQPDRVKILYGSQSQVVNASTLQANMASATSDVLELNNFGVRAGDLIVLLEPGSGKNCTLMEVTQSVLAQPVQHNNTGYQLTWYSGTPNVNSRFNKAGGAGVAYGGANTANATRIYNLGNLYDLPWTPAAPRASNTLPVYNTYYISSNSLRVTAGFLLDANGLPLDNAIADNIVHLRALYGMNDGTFTNATPAAANWGNVVSVRIAVVARSARTETTRDASGNIINCATTVAGSPSLNWTGGAFDVSATAPNSDPTRDYWNCYRYRVFETTVPLRNWIWKSS